MINESLLPVGSCVKIANNSKSIMIAGYLFYDNQNKKMYDYIGVYTPIGVKKPKQNVELNKSCTYFNNRDIEKTLFLGYSDEESDFYCKYLSNIRSRLSKIEKSNLTDNDIKKILKVSLPNIRDINELGADL